MRTVRPQSWRGRSHRRALAASLLAVLVTLAVPAAQAYRTGKRVAVAGNPADPLAGQALDPESYDYAKGCDPRPRAGTKRLVAWLKKNFKAPDYGVYRCEGTSLHSEWRAIDWMLDHRVPAQRRTGERLIKLLLAPDSKGHPRALARRMGIQELIWDCSYWSTSADRAGRDFQPYGPCHGGVIDPTQGHIDHIHIGITVAGSRARTSFWTSGADGAPVTKTVGAAPVTVVSPGGGVGPG
jgi:hypothetical protein